MHFMPNNNLEENISHFILIAPTKKNCLQKLHFKFLELKNCIWGTRFQVPESFPALRASIIGTGCQITGGGGTMSVSIRVRQ